MRMYVHIYIMSTPGFPGEPHGQRLAGYSPQGHKEPDMTKHSTYI